MGTGFFACRDGYTSNQQDVLIYEAHQLPLLFQLEDLVVVDHEALVGAVEVKTTLDQREFQKAWAEMPKLRGKFYGVFAWEGVSLETALGYYEQALLTDGWAPSVVYVRDSYLIYTNSDGSAFSLPLTTLEVGSDFTNGDALLAFLYCFYWKGVRFSGRTPWWLSEMGNHHREHASQPQLTSAQASVRWAFLKSNDAWAMKQMAGGLSAAQSLDPAEVESAIRDLLHEGWLKDDGVREIDNEEVSMYRMARA